MANWKVISNINNWEEEKTIFIKDVDTKEEAYLKTKRYFIVEQPEIDFCGVKSAVKI